MKSKRDPCAYDVSPVVAAEQHVERRRRERYQAPPLNLFLRMPGGLFALLGIFMLWTGVIMGKVRVDPGGPSVVTARIMIAAFGVFFTLSGYWMMRLRKMGVICGGLLTAMFLFTAIKLTISPPVTKPNEISVVSSLGGRYLFFGLSAVIITGCIFAVRTWKRLRWV